MCPSPLCPYLETGGGEKKQLVTLVLLFFLNVCSGFGCQRCVNLVSLDVLGLWKLAQKCICKVKVVSCKGSVFHNVLYSLNKNSFNSNSGIFRCEARSWCWFSPMFFHSSNDNIAIMYPYLFFLPLRCWLFFLQRACFVMCWHRSSDLNTLNLH